MNISKIERKALDTLLEEFQLPKYSEIVKKEIADFKSGVVAEIGYMSEGDDVVLEIKRESAMLTYRLWTDDNEQEVEGIVNFEVDEIISELEKALNIAV